MRAGDDTPSQFEILSKLVQEVQAMRANLGQLVADFAAQWELAVSISGTPCGLCAAGNGHTSAQDDDFKESQLP